MRSIVALGVMAVTGAALAAPQPFEKVSKDYERVVSTADSSLYTLWTREKDGQVLAELPRNFESQKFYLVPTVAGGSEQTGVYSIWHDSVGIPSRQLYWKRYGDQLALIAPNLDIRSTGDAESKQATERVYTDQVILTTPVVSKGPGGGPVIDLDSVLLDNAGKFFGRFVRGANFKLRTITTAKAFPNNVELGFEFPQASGRLGQIRYSIGMPAKSAAYKPREADRRVGIYYVDWTDRSKNDGESQKRRYVTRWHLEKADPSLKMSPPKKPIVYYIEHTTPIRYRRWVRDGILAWNKAFENVGIVGAIEVRQQDARTGAYMDIDPEDIRYSFVRWTNSHMGFAIGPVHAHVDTGEIYEADIVMDEVFLVGWANSYFQTQLASVAMHDIDPGLADWLAANPGWDPRYRLAEPADRQRVRAYQRALAAGEVAGLEAPPTMRPEVWSAHLTGLRRLPGVYCTYMPGKSNDVGLMRAAIELGVARLDEDESDEGSMLDGLPEDFIGPMLKDVIMHEVGHTLGLMHNWKGSSLHGFDEINSAEMKGRIPLSSTVMDYMPTNIVVEDGELIQGDWAPIDIGAYDHWAIEWAYTFDDPAEVAKRGTEPEHAFTAEDGAFSPDPRAKTWDLGANSIDHAAAQIALVEHVRPRILDKGVKDGQSWQKARQLFQQTLSLQLSAVSKASGWIGGAHITKARKGDPGARDPIVPVDLEQQRRALAFVLQHAFHDEAFGLEPEILAKLGSDNWYDEGYGTSHDWPIHDQVLGIQASAMTMLLNPTRLRRVQDNELRVAPQADALTVPEILNAIRGAVWSELASAGDGAYSERKPLVSSLRRNLQSEHVGRLIDLARGMNWPGASGRDLRKLARQELRLLHAEIEAASAAVEDLDRYSGAHLEDLSERIEKALAAAYLLSD